MKYVIDIQGQWVYQSGSSQETDGGWENFTKELFTKVRVRLQKQVKVDEETRS